LRSDILYISWFFALFFGIISLFSYGAFWLAFSVGFWAGRGGQGGCFFGFFSFSTRSFWNGGKRQLKFGVGGFSGSGLGGKNDRCGLVLDGYTFFAQEDWRWLGDDEKVVLGVGFCGGIVWIELKWVESLLFFDSGRII